MKTVKVIRLTPYDEQPVPKCDNKTLYAFFDDGKSGYGRRYIAVVNSVVPFDEVKKKDKKLYKAWKSEVKNCYWLYAKETDYFISCTVFGYSISPIWFARTVDGGWFSFDYEDTWESGRLDVSGKICAELDLPEPKEWKAGVHYAGRDFTFE